MPMIDLRSSPGAVAPERFDALAEALTASLLAHREVPDTPQSRRNVWLFSHEAPTRVGGRQAEEPHVVVTFTIVAGGMSDDHRAALVADATRAVRAAAPGARVWVLVDEVPDGRWGAEGRITRLADAQAILGASS